jgi:hypothetical protein
VAGFVIPVLWFGMDFQGTADTEIQALQARQQYLAALAEQRHCGEDTGEPQRVTTEAPKASKAKAKPRPKAPAPEAAAEPSAEPKQ